MDTANPQVMPAPPNLAKSLQAGFDAVSSHVGVVVFSLVLDLVLWFGPRLPLNEILAPFLRQMPQESTPLPLTDLVQRLNLFGPLRSLPLGVPSLMTARSPLLSPLGKPLAWPIGSSLVFFTTWVALTLVGMMAGTLYFMMVCEASFGRSRFASV